MARANEYSSLPLNGAGLVALLILPALLVCGCSDESRETKMISSASSDSCMARGFSSRDNLVDWPEPDVKVTVEGLTINLVHTNATLNCCLDTIEVDFTHDGRLLMLREKEVVTMPCDCICPFEVEATIEVPSPGTYLLEIYTGVELVWSDEIEV